MYNQKYDAAFIQDNTRIFQLKVMESSENLLTHALLSFLFFSHGFM